MFSQGHLGTRSDRAGARRWYPGFYFLFTYIAKRGFLDGGAGLHYATYKAWYFRTIRLLIQEQSLNGK
jgi:hypothetical protein